MLSISSKLDNYLKRTLWEIREDSSGKFKNVFIGGLRLFLKIGQEFLNGEIPLRASSLVYTTLLTFVPVLAVAFSVVKAFGVHNMLIPFMRNLLAPLGAKGDEITFSIIGYVDRINVGLLGMIGLGALLYTVMNTLQQVENSFNYLWQVSEKRSLLRRFRDYMSVLLAGPVLVVSALGITTSVTSYSLAQKIISIEPFGTALLFIGELLPFILISVTFTFMYYLLPCTKVNFRSALAGGVSAGIMWQAGSWIFARFIMSSTQYSAIYSGFAIVLLFMIWLYYNWVIVLTGVKISFYHQFPVLLNMRDDRMIYGEWYMQRLTIIVMYLIGYDYFHGNRHWTLPLLMARLRTPKGVVQRVLEALKESGLILRIDADNAFVPARDIETITLNEIVNSVRDKSRGAYSPLSDFMPIPGIEKILQQVEDAIQRTLSEKTLKELVVSHTPDNKETI